MEAFRKVKDAITMELQSESFPRFGELIFLIYFRFVRSKTFLKYLQSKDSKYISTVSTTKSAQKYVYTDNDFIDHVVTDNDFDFAQRMIDDDFNWELQAFHKTKSSVVSGYWSYANYMPKVSWVCVFFLCVIVANKYSYFYVGWFHVFHCKICCYFAI